MYHFKGSFNSYSDSEIEGNKSKKEYISPLFYRSEMHLKRKNNGIKIKRIDFTLQLQCYYTANSMLLEGKSSAFKTRLCSEWVFTHQQIRKSLRGFY